MLCGTMLGKLPLLLTSFANLTTDESFEAVPIATDYEKLIPIHCFYFPASLTSGVKIRTVGRGKSEMCQRKRCSSLYIKFVIASLFGPLLPFVTDRKLRTP